MLTTRPVGGILLGLLSVFAPLPAAAQWTRVLGEPLTNVSSVWANGDTIAAAADSTVYVSMDAGLTWKHSTRVAVGVTLINAQVVHHGRVIAGTFGRGVFVSHDFGDTWLSFNQGLTGGRFRTHNFITDLLLQDDVLYATTAGAGVYVRNLVAGDWVHFGEQFEPHQASNVNGIAAGGNRLLAGAGANGSVFFRDLGDPDWTLSWLNNVGLVPGLSAQSAVWTGSGWVVGANRGVYRSALGQEPWSLVDLDLGPLLVASFVARGRDLFAAFGIGGQTLIHYSADDGATWKKLDALPRVAVNQLAMSGTELYAARLDGLWHRDMTTVVQPVRWGDVKSKFR
jgi:lipid-binding SYLF domain-containing protein